jgi:cation:H+ antiporter
LTCKRSRPAERSITASERKSFDSGPRVVGSNIFNTLFITGVTSILKPMQIPLGGHLDLAATAIVSLSLFFVARTHNQRIIRYQGMALLALWGFYVIGRSLFLSV